MVTYNQLFFIWIWFVEMYPQDCQCSWIVYYSFLSNILRLWSKSYLFMYEKCNTNNTLIDFNFIYVDIYLTAWRKQNQLWGNIRCNLSVKALPVRCPNWARGLWVLAPCLCILYPNAVCIRMRMKLISRFLLREIEDLSAISSLYFISFILGYE